MNLIILAVFILIVLVALSVFAVLVIRKESSGLKVMLLGIALILCGGAFMAGGETDLAGVEIFVLLIGLAAVIFGFLKEN